MAPVYVADPDHAALYQALNSIVDKMDEIAKNDPFALGDKPRHSDAGAELRSLADLIEHRMNMMCCGAPIDRNYFHKESVAEPLRQQLSNVSLQILRMQDHLNVTRRLQEALFFSCGNSFSTTDANSALAHAVEKRILKLGIRLERLRKELA